IYLGDSLYVHPEWPSPQQFNHAIIAIRIAESADTAATVLNPKLGKLLIFDPTDSETPLGELSDDLRGSFGLINAGHDGDLQRMPPSDSHLNRMTRELEVTLSAD